MAVRPGYKHTEVGVIPEDWAVKPLGSFCEISAGGDLVQEDYSPASDHRHEFPIYSNALTDGGLYGYSKSYQYGPDKITVTARGDIGHAVYRSTSFCAIGRLLVLSSTHPCDLRFVTEFINNFVDFALESTGVPQLTAPQISQYAVALPPTKAEQEAIAEALSDADALIESLKQLLSKKRQLKQGAMQHLLTGKKRLPGFSGEWKRKVLGDFAELRPGEYLAQDAYRPGSVAVQGAGNIMGWHDAANFPQPVSVIGRVGTVGRPRFMPSGCWVNNNAAALVAIPSRATPAFLHSILETIPWNLVVSTTAQPFLEVGTLLKLDFEIPDVPEQTAIAAILSDMGAEISALEAKHAKARQLKQGMMQELLTGRIRLV